MDPELQAALQGFEGRHFFISIQTGPWRGKGDWSYKILCIECGWEEVVDTYEEACDRRAKHREDNPVDEWDDVV